DRRLPEDDILFYFSNLMPLPAVNKSISNNAICTSYNNIFNEDIAHIGSMAFEIITTSLLCLKYKKELIRYENEFINEIKRVFNINYTFIVRECIIECDSVIS